MTVMRIQPPGPELESTSTSMLTGGLQFTRLYLMSMRPSDIGPNCIIPLDVSERSDVDFTRHNEAQLCTDLLSCDLFHVLLQDSFKAGIADS